MSLQFNRIGRVVFLLTSVALVLSFAGLFYYLNIKENERYQNRLHFRELSQIQGSLEKGVEGFSKLGKKFQRVTDRLAKQHSQSALTPAELEEFKQSFTDLTNLSTRLDVSKNAYTAEQQALNALQENDVVQKSQIQKRNEHLNKLREGVDAKQIALRLSQRKQEQAKAEASQFLESFPNVEEFIEPQYLNEIVDQCDFETGFCAKFRGWFEALFNVDTYKQEKPEDVESAYNVNYAKVVCDPSDTTCEYNQLQKQINERRQALQGVIQLFDDDDLEGKANDKIKNTLLCHDSFLWEGDVKCEAVQAYLLSSRRGVTDNQQNSEGGTEQQADGSEPQTNQPKQQVAAPVSKDELAALISHLAFLEQTEKQKTNFLQKFVESVKSSGVGKNASEIFKKYLQASLDVKTNEVNFEQARSSYQNAEKAALVLDASSASSEKMEHQIERTNKARRIYDKLLAEFESAKRRMTNNIETASDRIESAASESKDLDIHNPIATIQSKFLKCLQASLKNGTYNMTRCSASPHQTKEMTKFEELIGNAFIKSQKLTREAFPSIAYCPNHQPNHQYCAKVMASSARADSDVQLISPAQTKERGVWKLSIPLIKHDYDVQSADLNLEEQEIYYGNFTILLNDLLPKETGLFPLILMVDDEGRLMFRKENIAAGSSQSGLYFEMVDDILKTLAKKQTFKSESDAKKQSVDINVKTNDKNKPASSDKKDKSTKSFPGYSGQIEIEIAKEKYSVFISPWGGFARKAEQDNASSEPPLFYVIGVTPKSQLTIKKLAIPNSTLVAIVFCLLAIMALIPLIKMRLVSYRQAFTKGDRQHIAIGLSLLVILLVTGTLHFLIYQHWKQSIEDQNVQAFKDIKQSFKKEVNNLSKLAKTELVDIRLDIYPKSHESSAKAHIFDWNLRSEQNLSDGPFFENAFLLDTDGVIRVNDHFDNPQMNGVFGRWSSEALTVRSDLPVDHRAYFNAAKHCKGWYLSESGAASSCEDLLYLQRIMSLVDGRKTTQFSVPLFDKKSERPEQGHIVYSFGTRLKTFLSPILPLDSGFAVVDERGNVLFHSDDERSLVENIFVETDNNSELRSFVRSPFKQEYIDFAATYRGKAHLFVAGKLNKAMPWTLIIFHDKQNTRNLSMLMGFSAVIILFLLLLLCQATYLFLQAINQGHYVRAYTWFNMKLVDNKAYKSLIYVLLIVSVTFLFFVILVSYLSQSELPTALMFIGILVYWGILWLALTTTRKLCDKNDDSAKPVDNRSYLSPDDKDVSTYSLYLIVLLFAFWSIPSFVVINESASFYLQKYANFERHRLEENHQRAEQVQSNYFELVVDKPISKSGENYDKLKAQFGTVKNFSGLPLEMPKLGSSHSGEGYWVHLSQQAKASAPGVFSAIWRNIDLGYTLASDISVYAKIDATRFSENKTSPNIRAIAYIKILGDAIIGYWHLALLFLVLGSFSGWWLVNQGVCRKLMGLYIPQNLRLNDSHYKSDNRLSLLKRMAIDDAKTHKAQYAQLIRSTGSTRRMFNKHDSSTEPSVVPFVNKLNLLTERPVSFYDLQFDTTKEFDALLKSKLNITSDNIAGTLVLSGLEMTAMNDDARTKALKVLGELISKKHLNIILLADIAPLFRLTRQADYPGVNADKQAPVHEVIQWSRLLKRFVKYYDWTPRSRVNLLSSATSFETLKYEAKSWPELKTIRSEFYEYHVNIKDRQLDYVDRRVTKNGVELTKKQLEASINDYWLPEQVVEFFAANAGATYRYRWELCTQEERLLLIQVANGCVPNPRHLEPIEHLVRRGYLYQYNGWHIINKSFSRYLLTAENEKTVAAWMSDANESSWRYIRAPLFALMIAVLGLIAYTATEAFESFAAILTAALGILPLILRGIGMARGDASSLSDD